MNWGAYWLRSAARAKASQRLSLDLARYNPHGSPARRAWLESARLDGQRKRQALAWSLESEAA